MKTIRNFLAASLIIVVVLFLGLLHVFFPRYTITETNPPIYLDKVTGDTWKLADDTWVPLGIQPRP